MFYFWNIENVPCGQNKPNSWSYGYLLSSKPQFQTIILTKMLKTGNFSFLEITGFRSIKYKTDLEFGFCDLDLPLEARIVPINCQFKDLKLPVFKPV